MTLRITFAAVVFVVQAGLASAQSATPVTLTLDDAINRGLAASHRVEEAMARKDGAEAAINNRQSAAKPQIAVLAGYSRTNHVDEFGVPLPNNQLRVIYPDVPDNYRTRLDAQWPIYTGGRVDALVESARLDATAAADEADALRSDLRFEIARAFWSLFLADESTRVLDEALERARAHTVDVRNQQDAGLVPPSDVMSARAQESRQRMLGIQARSTRASAEAELARLVGLSPGGSIRLNGGAEPVTTATAFDALLARALEQRRDRRALATRLAAATSREHAAAAGKRPTIALAGGLDYARPNPRIFPRAAEWQDSWDAGVNVSWSLFDGGRVRAEVAEAQATRRAIQARIDELDSLVALDIRQRLAELEAARAAIEAANDAVEAATEAQRVLGERYRAGVATNTDVLSAQLAVTQSMLDRTQAVVNVRLVDARLQRALGQ